MLATPHPSNFPEPVIRRMTGDDIPAGDGLRAAAGWNQTTSDWRRLLASDPRGCFVAQWDQSVVGTVTTTRYGTGAAWIGMVLVHPEYRRRGIASALMSSALAYLRQNGVDCIMLDATPEGRSLYENLGFGEQWSSVRWLRAPRPGWNADLEIGLGDGPRDAPPFSLSASQAALDHAAFGVDRSDWLERLSDDSLVECHSEGFAMLRAGATACYLGPATAANATVAESLLDGLLREVTGPVIWDIPEPNSPAQAIATTLGFKPTRRLIRMAIGTLRPPPNPLLQFALADPATG